jgi:hypothetical protein
MPRELTKPPAVSHPREQYLRKEEGRIRSLASGLLASGSPDPTINAELTDIIDAEDMHDLFEVTADYYRDKGVSHREAIHRRHAEAAARFKLRALDRLAHLVL